MLFSVLFPEKLRIRENSRISGAGNSTAYNRVALSSLLSASRVNVLDIQQYDSKTFMEMAPWSR